MQIIIADPFSPHYILKIMKNAISRVVYGTVVVILIASLVSSTLTECECFSRDGVAEMEAVCASPCAQGGQPFSGMNSYESFSKSKNTRECSFCIDVAIDLPNRSARLQRVGFSRLGYELSSSRDKADHYSDLASEIIASVFNLTYGHFVIFAQPRLESTVLRC